MTDARDRRKQVTLLTQRGMAIDVLANLALQRIDLLAQVRDQRGDRVGYRVDHPRGLGAIELLLTGFGKALQAAHQTL